MGVETATAIPDTVLHYDRKAKKDAGKFFVPGDASERRVLADQVRHYVHESGLTPPLLMEELQQHSEHLLSALRLDRKYREYLYILVNNETWRPVIARIPFERRTLLLPPCLRASGKCPARFDELGLLCERCGRCPICVLSETAEDLGYTVLVAEGTTVVAKLVEQGKIDAVIGVSCMPALERTFPHVFSGAVPGLAIPLIREGCEDTAVDTETVLEAIRLRSDDPAAAGLMDMNRLHADVRSWFSEGALRPVLGAGTTDTERVALEWLAKSGKRWRPFLTAAVYHALNGRVNGALPDNIRKVAVAVECIHKASLIYDDIQDNDAQRYGDPTVHEVYGVPVAMTASLLLLGYGYRLISESGTTPAVARDMLHLATSGHCTLCLGQGGELWWMRNPQPLSSEAVLRIFSLKTAPSFEVVFRLGALAADADPAIHDILRDYSEAVGIAYQIQDDLQDFTEGGDVDDIRSRRPSIVLAVAYENATPAERDVISAVWGHEVNAARANAIRAIIAEHGIASKVREILARYKQRAVRALVPLRNSDLKMVLCRVVGKIFREA